MKDVHHQTAPRGQADVHLGSSQKVLSWMAEMEADWSDPLCSLIDHSQPQIGLFHQFDRKNTFLEPVWIIRSHLTFFKNGFLSLFC